MRSIFHDDYPLLGTPTLTALILHTCADGRATTADCHRRLVALYERAGETLPLSPEAIAARLERQVRHLEAARLIVAAGDGFEITERGRDALVRHPKGLAQADLTEYPEFAAYLQARSPHAAGMDPRPGSYQEGYAARQRGETFTVNPYTLNSVDHSAWENGWMQALDDEAPPIRRDDSQLQR